MEGDFDLYETLNVSRNASQDEIRAAFHESSRRPHPDVSSARSTAFMQAHQAYSVLSDDVLRSFYDRYGLAGVRLAQGMSDEEAGGSAKYELGLPEDRLRHLEARVKRLMATHEELRVQQRLTLQGSFTLSLALAPGPHGAHFRRRHHIHYSAISQSVQLAIGERIRLSTGCAAHVQGINGLGAAKLMLAVDGKLDSSTDGRAAVNIVGGSLVEGEMTFRRKLTQACLAQQKVSMSADGVYTIRLGLFPWLSNLLQGSFEYVFGDQHGISLGLIRRSSSSRYKLSASANLQPGLGEISLHAKVKPSNDFSLTVSPGLSPKGLVLGLDCSKSSQDGLTKLHWILRLRQHGASLRLVFNRAGLQFAFPVELWPESSGLLPLSELFLAVAVWALPPLLLRFLSSVAFYWMGWSHGAETSINDAKSRPILTTVPKAVVAEEQRQLLAPAAAKKRQDEAARGGLEILAARYGDSKFVKESHHTKVLDVTDCLMAWVRASRLELSDAPKSSLIGFHDDAEENSTPSVLYVRYRFGNVEHERIFGDTDAVILP